MPASNGRIWRCTFQPALARARTLILISARGVDIKGGVLARVGADSTVSVPCYSAWLTGFNGSGNNLKKERTTPYKKCMGFLTFYAELSFPDGWCSGSTLASSKREHRLLDTLPLKLSTPCWRRTFRLTVWSRHKCWWQSVQQPRALWDSGRAGYLTTVEWHLSTGDQNPC